METSVWIAAIGLGTTVVGTAKYMVNKISDSNTTTVTALKAQLEDYKKENKELKQDNYVTKSKLEAATTQINISNTLYSEMTKQVKLFIELTLEEKKDNKEHRKNTDKDIELLKENIGKVIRIIK